MLSRRELLKAGCCGAAMWGAGGMKGAAAQGRGGASGPIDVHAHFFPQRFMAAVNEQGPPGVSFDLTNPGAVMFVTGPSKVQLDPTFWDMAARIKRMDAVGVRVHTLSLTTPFVHWAPPDRGAALARIVNEAVVEAHTAYPDRFIGCATLPYQAPELAVAELDRIAGSKAIRGVYMPTSFPNKELSDPSFFPIYAKCEALNMPIMLHPDRAAAAVGATRLQPFYLTNLIGNPVESAIAASYLVFGGVMDRFPKLTVVLPHGGGALPYLSGRMQHGQSVRPEVKGKAQLPLMDYLRRFYYDTITHDPRLLRFLIDLVGVDRVMLGSDYCFDMGPERPREVVEALKLRGAEREAIYIGNAVRLLRL